MRFRKHIAVAVAVLGLALAGGCQSQYYRVTDVQSGREFYTAGWLPGMYGRSGAIRFTELGSGDYVTLPASRVSRVTEGEARTSRPAPPRGAGAATAD